MNNKKIKKQKKSNDKVKKIVFDIACVIGSLMIVAFSFGIGLGAPWAANVAFAFIAIAGWVVAGCVGYSIRFKKNWDNDPTTAQEYLETKDSKNDKEK